MAMMCGGKSDMRDPDQEVHDFVAGVREAVQNAHNGGNAFTDFTCVKYKSQVVAGTNFFFKIKTGEGAFAHVSVFRPLPHTGQAPEVKSFEGGKTE